MYQKDFIYSILLFLLSPAIALFAAFKNSMSASSYNVIWFFSGFMGLTFAGYGSDYTSDLTRYLEEFNLWKIEDRGLSYLINNSYVEYGYQDIFFPFISLISAKIGLPDIAFLGLIGLIFGFFYSRVYKILVSDIQFNKDFFLIVLIITFLLIIPIWRGINGIRFSLGAIIFVYLILRSYNTGFNFKTVLLISSLFLIHFSMALPIFAFLLFLTIKKVLNTSHLFFLYIISFFFTSINLDILNESLKNYVPLFLYRKVDAYARESIFDEIIEETSNTNWYALVFTKALFYAISIMVVYIYIKYKDLKDYNVRFDYLIKFTFLFTIIVNLLNFIPSLGRMALISNTLVMYIFIFLISNLKNNSFHLFHLKFLLFPLLLLYITVQMRIGFDFMSVETIIGNPMITLFNIEKIPLIDLIK